MRRDGVVAKQSSPAKEEEPEEERTRQLVNSKQLSRDARYSIPCYALLPQIAAVSTACSPSLRLFFPYSNYSSPLIMTEYFSMSVGSFQARQL